MDTQLPDTPYILCQSCKTKNPSEATRCSNCNADLLPGKTLMVRFLYGGLVVVGIGIIILSVRMEIPGFLSDIFILFSGRYNCYGVIVLSLITIGLLGAFSPSALSDRYLYRADRHFSISPGQAVHDYTLAINMMTADLAKCGILLKRAEALLKLGRVAEALSDLQACIDTPQPMPKPKHAYSFEYSSYTNWKNQTDKARLRIEEIKRDNQH